MIKRYKFAGLVLSFLAFGLTSCQDKLLNLSPPSDLTEVDFYKTAKDMDGAVLGIYSRYQVTLPKNWIVREMPSDNLYMTGYFNINGLDELNKLAFEPDNTQFNNFWVELYNGVFRSNAVLINIDSPTDYKDGQKEQFTGEAKFMRALFYFDLVRMYGGVPNVTTLLSFNEARAVPRASEEEIYALIVEDLKAAIELLPTQDKIATGRVSKGAAVALLAKVYVYQNEWSNAKTYLDMMSSFNYQLLDNFADLWSLEKEDNNEGIFTIKYTDGTNGHTLSTDFLPYFGVTGVSTRGNENAFPTWSLIKSFEDGDKRKAATITEFWKSPVSPPGQPENWYPYVSKYAVKHTQNASGLDLPVLRYGDVVLLKAEVLYRLNQPGLALIELNKIRERAFGNSSHNYTLADIAAPEDFLDKLLLERRLEFAGESERWFDLVRTGRFLTDLNAVERSYNYETKTSNDVVDKKPKAYQNHFPIPQIQIQQANAGVLTQNEGYD